jgi:hypothetical protein
VGHAAVAAAPVPAGGELGQQHAHAAVGPPQQGQLQSKQQVAQAEQAAVADARQRRKKEKKDKKERKEKKRQSVAVAAAAAGAQMPQVRVKECYPTLASHTYVGSDWSPVDSIQCPCWSSSSLTAMVSHRGSSLHVGITPFHCG